MPAVGLGTWQSKPDAVRAAVKDALLAGYRHIDTYVPQPDSRSVGSLDHRALAYGNEDEVGQGIKDSGVPREDIWVTTKLFNNWHHRAQEGIETSLKSLGLTYVDLYLMHWPCSTDPSDSKKHLPHWDFKKTWQAAPAIHAS
jgi:glycerol 2-dehydrogenase (NADP+)